MINESFYKMAKALFDPSKAPPLTNIIAQPLMIDGAKQDKLKGLSPVQRRLEIARKNRGILARMRRMPRI